MISMKQPGKLRAYMGLLSLILSLAGEYFLLICIMSVIFGRGFWQDFTHSRLSHFQSATYITVLYLVVLCTIIWFWNFFTHESVKNVGVRLQGRWVSQFALGIATGCGAIILYYAPLAIIGLARLTPLPQIIEKVATLAFWKHISLNCAVSLAMAFTEEFIFRGVIFRIFLKNVSRTHALIAANAFFGFCHMFTNGPWSMKLMYFVTLLIFGIALATTVLRTDALWWAIGIHFTLMFFVIVRGTLGTLEIVRGPWEFFYGVNGHPMAGLWSIVVFTAMIFFVKKL